MNNLHLFKTLRSTPNRSRNVLGETGVLLAKQCYLQAVWDLGYFQNWLITRKQHCHNYDHNFHACFSACYVFIENPHFLLFLHRPLIALSCHNGSCSCWFFTTHAKRQAWSSRAGHPAWAFHSISYTKKIDQQPKILSHWMSNSDNFLLRTFFIMTNHVPPHRSQSN